MFFLGVAVIVPGAPLFWDLSKLIFNFGNVKIKTSNLDSSPRNIITSNRVTSWYNLEIISFKKNRLIAKLDSASWLIQFHQYSGFSWPN